MTVDHDRFHAPTSDDPYWTETCWFTFAVPDRKLSGQLYPFFRPNQGVTSGAAFVWDDAGDQPWNCRYGKNFWHLPLEPDADLADLSLPNGITYRCLEPGTKYAIGYTDPDSDDPALVVDLTFTATCAPNMLGDGHLDQPGRYTGTILLDGETIPVDDYGMRDRSWGVRSQFGDTLTGSGAARGGYSYATASATDAFHALTMCWDEADGAVVMHGYLLRDGEYAKLASGRRDVIERVDGCPTRVRIEAVDELGRELVAESQAYNRFGVHLNPNLFTWNCLSEWSFNGTTGWGEDHDNWSAPAARVAMRAELFG